MADAATLRRVRPLAAHQQVSIVLLPPSTRLSVRGGPEAARRLGTAFGVELSTDVLRARQAGERVTLWLGPDEWLLIAGEDAGLAGDLDHALAGEPGSVVDVSHRNAGLDVSGEAVARVLNTGCPLDLGLAAFPVGMCTRTVLAKADVVLWRQAEDRFHLECWRSFVPYVIDFLTEGAAGA
jgi:sarcosine oxidase subunit gamma